MNMVNTRYNSTKDMINKLQSLKGKAKLNFYKNISNYYDNMNIKMKILLLKMLKVLIEFTMKYYY